MNKETIPLPSDVECITVMIFHLIKMLFHNSNNYMNFIYSLHIEHFIDMELFLAIPHEAMFMRDKDFPTCKLSKLGDPTGAGRGG